MKYLIIFALGISLSACQKKDSDGYDQNKLTLNISKPSEAQTFAKGDTVFISANATYNTQLHGYTLYLMDTTNNTVFMNLEAHLHDSHFAIDTFWVNTLESSRALQLAITIEVDHDGNEKTESVHFLTTN
ncbi:MAG: hypothetical protein IT256_00430 [Chitinophagaceae bacterium]|nr:hypothetical protein [Chitinophagaceae bacterium]